MHNGEKERLSNEKLAICFCRFEHKQRERFDSYGRMSSGYHRERDRDRDRPMHMGEKRR